MKINSFKDWDTEFIGFANSGGNPDTYKDFNSFPSLMLGYGGGPPTEHYIKKIDENLNPREKPLVINSNKHYLEDPEKDNRTNSYSPEDIGISKKEGIIFVYPNFNNEHIKNIKSLLDNTDTTLPGYNNILTHYNTNSYNLNNTLVEYGRNSKLPPNIIKANNNEDSKIDIRELDKLIKHHSLQHGMTVYSGLHFHPLQYKGKVARMSAYLSTSLSPHVSKDFGLHSDYFDDLGDKHFVKNILRLHLPPGHPHLFTDPSSTFSGQGELILPRNMKIQLGQQPTHIINGAFNNHFYNKPTKEITSYHIWTGRIIP
jgi:hypothetical protein